jgi:integrative and conjugative element protein (TIGR02256 family)
MRIPAGPLLFTSSDGHFGLSVPTPEVEKMLGYCAGALPNETGGILIGRYSEALDTALVVRVTPAPPDSRSGRTWFYRGTRGLRTLLTHAWEEGNYYLGEWHFHPLAGATPSSADRRQVRDIARDDNYRCPSPLLLIIGGHPLRSRAAKAYVFSRSGEEAELLLRKTPG